MYALWLPARCGIRPLMRITEPIQILRASLQIFDHDAVITRLVPLHGEKLGAMAW
jgi:hypothetical protein